MMGFSLDDTTSMLVRILWILIDLNLANTLLFDLLLITQVVMSFKPTFVSTICNRRVNPRKSKLRGYFFSLLPLKCTILVFPGCSCNLQACIRCCITASTNFACFSVLQWTMISSAYRSNGLSGWFFSIHSSNTTCKNILANNGLMTPPCGVPVSLSVIIPFSCSIPALSHLSIYISTHLSLQ